MKPTKFIPSTDLKLTFGFKSVSYSCDFVPQICIFIISAYTDANSTINMIPTIPTYTKISCFRLQAENKSQNKAEYLLINWNIKGATVLFQGFSDAGCTVAQGQVHEHSKLLTIDAFPITHHIISHIQQALEVSPM